MVKKNRVDKNIEELTKAVKELTKVIKGSDLNINKENVSLTPEIKRVNIKYPDALVSPMVGTVYLSPEPGAKTFIQKGQSIKNGETLLIIEAMKTFNPIKASKSGKVIKILVNDGESVEFGQPLLVIK